MTCTVGDHIALALVSRGIRRCFGYLGFQIEPFPQALVRAGCDVLMAASETGAGFMAHGLALATGRPALMFCGGGPGLAMLIPALQAARLEGVPVLAIVGQSGTDELTGFQDTTDKGSRDRQLLAALEIGTVHLATVAELGTALHLVWERLAASAPAVLTIPRDVLASPVSGASSPSLPPRQQGADAPTGSGAENRSGPCGSEPEPLARRPLSYRSVVVALLQSLPSQTLWFGDAGQTRHAMRMELEPRRIRLHDCPSTGPMGWAIGAAIGAACHDRPLPVCCFTGDGSARMLANEWSTAVQRHLPVTFVLAVNGVLGGPYGRLHDTEAAGLTRLPELHWCGWAASMGLPAVDVRTDDTIAEALARLPPDGPRLLVVPLPAQDHEIAPLYSI